MGCGKSKPKEPQKSPSAPPKPPVVAPKNIEPVEEKKESRKSSSSSSRKSSVKAESIIEEIIEKSLHQDEIEDVEIHSDRGLILTGAEADLYSDLPQAAFACNIEKIKEQVAMYKEEDRDVNEKDPEGFTAAHRGAMFGDWEVMNILKNAGCDIERLSQRGEAPLHVAVFHRNFVAVKFILSHCDKAHVNIQESTFGFTPLHVAVLRGVPGIADALLNSGASITTKSHSGHTPFTASDAFKSFEAVGLTSPKSRHGLTAQALELFTPGGHDEVVVGA
eukprot:Selendium_serpulae@DN5264_c0_g1_i4.p1